MTKTAVIYKSKYGSTKKYASWISQRLNADVFESSKVNISKLREYDTLIFGGGLYADRISGISFLTKNYEKLKEKNLIVFTVGIRNTDDSKMLKSIYKTNFKPEMKNNIAFFNYQGCLELDKLKSLDRIIMKMVINVRDKKSNKNQDDIDFVNVCKSGEDFCKKENICSLVSYVKSI